MAGRKRLSELIVEIRGEDGNLSTALGRVTKRMDALGKRVSKIGRTMTANVTLPLAAAGAAAFRSGDLIDEAMAQIRAGTGATGEQLAGLGEDFRAVFRQVPQQADEVSKAVADLNTRLGLAGAPLQEMATQVLNLSRITEEDLDGVIQSSTRVMGDWGVAAKDQSRALDELFLVSQNTGIGINSLGAQLVQYGAPLRQMGFGFQEAAALIGKFEQEGVNAELVMGSLRIALGRMAQEGVTNTADALREITRRIQEAGTVGEANTLALKSFGAEAGPDMAAAIREGRFEIGALLEELRNSPETINQAAAETMTFSESMAKLRNQATLALEPLGRQLLQAFETMQPNIEAAISALGRLTQWFAELPGPVQAVALGFTAFAAAAGPVLFGIGQMVTLASSLVGILPTLQVAFSALTGPIGLGAAAFLAVAAAGKAVIDNWSVLKYEAERLARNVVEGLVAGFEKVVGFVREKVGNFFQVHVIDRAKQILGIQSPSTIFLQIGENVVAGFIEGLEKSGRGIGQSLDEALEELKVAIRSWADDFVDVVAQGVVEGSWQFKEFTKSVLADLAKIAARFAIFSTLRLIFGGMTGGVGGFISSALGFSAPAAAAASPMATPGFSPALAPAPAAPVMNSFVLDTSALPRASTPFDVVRDAQWMEILSRSLQEWQRHGGRLS